MKKTRKSNNKGVQTRRKYGKFSSDYVIEEIEETRSLKIRNVAPENLPILHLGHVNGIWNNNATGKHLG